MARRIIIVGGGAAGFFAAVTAANADSTAEVTLLEKGRQFLQKVLISGGGRCNVTHACFEPRALTQRYPRGERALIAPFHRFSASDTVLWFQARGVQLKTEPDGRMFPTTDSSETIARCLLQEAERAGVHMHLRTAVTAVERQDDLFTLKLSNNRQLTCERLLLATGGCRAPAAGALVESLGHTLEPPVPSLFTFHLETPWLRELPGIAVDPVEATVPGCGLRERGPLLITHWGVSGPAILRLSAWGARKLHALDYKFPLHVNWLPALTHEAILAEFQQRRTTQPGKLVFRTPLAPLPARLWEKMAAEAGIGSEIKWTTLPRPGAVALADLLHRTVLPVTGKSLNKDEFVTCGGVRLREVDFRTMESRVCPGLFFAGELLDIDGITGGFNFQVAWTTGSIAGHAIAE